MSVVLAKPEPTELADGLLLRTAHRSGVRDVPTLLLAMRRALHLDGEDVPTCLIAARAYGTDQCEFARRYTCAPFRQAFFHRRRTTRLPRFSLERRNLGSTGHKMCPRCAEEDLEWHGFSYWRVHHQPPGITACAKHGCGLIWFGIAASRLLPDECLGHLPQLRHRVLAPPDNAVAERYHFFVNAVLELKAPLCAATFAKRLRELPRAAHYGVSRQSFVPTLGDALRLDTSAEAVWAIRLLEEARGHSGRGYESLNRAVEGVYCTAVASCLAAALLTDSEEQCLALLAPAPVVLPPEKAPTVVQSVENIRRAYVAAGGSYGSYAKRVGVSPDAARGQLSGLGLPTTDGLTTRELGALSLMQRGVPEEDACIRTDADRAKIRRFVTVALAPAVNVAMRCHRRARDRARKNQRPRSGPRTA